MLLRCTTAHRVDGVGQLNEEEHGVLLRAVEPLRHHPHLRVLTGYSRGTHGVLLRAVERTIA